MELHKKLLELLASFQEGTDRFITQMGNSQISVEARMFQAGMFARFCNEYSTAMEKIVRKDATQSPPTTQAD